MQPNPSSDPAATAADWLARRDAGLSPAEAQALAAWLAADPRHAAAWEEAESLWVVLDRVREHGLADGMASELAARQRRRRWKVQLGWATGLAAAAAVAFALLTPRQHTPVVPAASAQVLISRPERQVLEDGSVVELNRGAQIAVHYTAERREVRLQQGEALFTVTKNPNRPFVVLTDGVAVRAVGTAFAVHRGEESVDVLVTEGRVAVDRPATKAAPAPVFVSAGGRLIVPTAEGAAEELEVETLAAAEMQRRLAWRRAQMDLSGTRLQDAVDALNRESATHITVADSALAELRLSGIFDANNAEGFVRSLEDDSTLGVVAERRAHEIVLRGR